MDSSLTAEQLESIRQALLSGNKIEAIKRYRTAMGGGLAEAKHAVEDLRDQWSAASPGEFPKLSGTGCFGLLCLLGAGFGGALYFTCSSGLWR